MKLYKNKEIYMRFDLLSVKQCKKLIVFILFPTLLLLLSSYSMLGKVSNNFGDSVEDDLDEDGDIDSAVVLYDLNGVSHKIVVDSNEKIYIAGESLGRGNCAVAFIARLNNRGKLDYTFGENGKVFFNSIANGNGNDFVEDLLVLDQKIYVVGRSSNGKNADAFVVRLNNDGCLDNNFGKDGKVILSNISSGKWNECATGIELDKEGKIYICGWCWGKDSDGFVIRLNNNGSLDYSFGKNGKVIIDNTGYEKVKDIKIDNSGKIYIVGDDSSFLHHGAFIMRLNSNGSIDYSFGKNGVVRPDRMIKWKDSNRYDEPDGGSGIAIYKEKIYFVGWSYESKIFIHDIYVAKFNNDGSLDKTFGKDGVVVFDKGVFGKCVVNMNGKEIVVGSDEYSCGILVDSSGGIYIAGLGYNVPQIPNHYNMFVYVVKLNSDGSISSNFAKSGRIGFVGKIKYAGFVEPEDIAIGKSGIYITGYCWFEKASWDFVKIRKSVFIVKIE